MGKLSHDIAVRMKLGTAEGGLHRCAMWLGLAAVLLTAGCGTERVATSQELNGKLAAFRTEQGSLRRDVVRVLAERAGAKLAAGEAPVLDVLAMSSGGQMGAFAVGVLEGWKARDASVRMPRFDVVSGVSAGALVAPFAFIGTDESLERVEQLYVQARADFVSYRDMFFFLPWRASIFDVSKLERHMRSAYPDATISAVAEAKEGNRLLLVGSTDLELGRLHAWDLTKAAEDTSADGRTRFRDLLIASAAIPAAFPTRRVDGNVHVDGGTCEQVYLGADVDVMEDVIRGYRAANPGAPGLTVRYWVIVNGRERLAVKVLDDGWLAATRRGVTTVTNSLLIETLRRIAAEAEVVSARTGATVETRYIAVPEQEEIPKTRGMFDPELSRVLVEIGRRAGRAGAWKLMTSIGRDEE